MKYKIDSLNCLADIQTGPFGSQLHNEDYVLEGTPIVTVEHLGEKNFKKQNLPFVSDADKERLSKYVLKTGDIVFSRVGSVDRCSYVSAKYDGWLFSGRCLRVRPNETLDPQYLYYYFCAEETKQFVRNIAVGATMPSINTALLGQVQISYPDIITQKKIAAILSALDEKIATNRAINDNLAEQAQGMLRHFMDQYQYQLNSLSTIAEVIDCLHSKKPSAIEGSTYQLIQLDNIRDDGFLDMSVCKYMISQADYENWTRKCEIIEGDCVITNVGRIGAVSQAPYGTRAAMGRNMTCIRMKSGLQLPAYFITALLSSHMRRQIQQNTDEGTIMGALNVKNIPKLLFPIFVPSVMSDLETILYPLRKQIEYNNLQNQNLAQLRDTLISRLMSGEIDVSAVQL